MSKFKNKIVIKGARSNNLKNVDLEIPLRKITCITGPSGSGKSSLAFHTLLAESKRRLMNCFPNNLKFFSEKPPAVDVDFLAPILPVFGLPQINPVKGSRTSVMDSLGLTHLVQSLYFYLSKPICPEHKEFLVREKLSSQILKKEKAEDNDVYYFFIRKDDYLDVFESHILPSRVYDEDSKEVLSFDKSQEYWEVVRCKRKGLNKLDKLANDLGEKTPTFFYLNGKSGDLKELRSSSKKSCSKCDYVEELEQNESLFSPYNAYGACSDCNGFGANLVVDKDKLVDRSLSVQEGGLKVLEHQKFKKYLPKIKSVLKKEKISLSKEVEKLPNKFWDIFFTGKGEWVGFEKIFKVLEKKKYKPGIRILLRRMQREEECLSCKGSRIDKRVSNFIIPLGDLNIQSFNSKNLEEIQTLITKEKKANKERSTSLVFEKMLEIIDTAVNIGLGHLELKRKTKSLSAGEYQRVLLVKYLSFEGTDSLFIFDEPSVGLDEAQQNLLFEGLVKIKNQGNTIVVVDHSETMIQKSDQVFWMGPGAGALGGEIVSTNTKKELPEVKNFSFKKNKASSFLSLKGASAYGKSYDSFKVPLGCFVWVHGKTGTGKTTVMRNILANELNYQVSGEYLFDRISSKVKLEYPSEKVQSVLVIDANLNRYTSRSTVGSITDLLTPLRKHFANLPISKAMGLSEGHFSANSALGRCPKCEGRGEIIIEMPYLEDVVLLCDECDGHKIQRDYALITDGKMTAAEAFERPIGEVFQNISLTPKYKKILGYIERLKLSYLSVHRNVASLSGGEKQRIYLLSKILSKAVNQVILVENFSFGLSQFELSEILMFLRSLVESKKSIILIDHNPIFSSFADWEIIFEKDGKIKSGAK